MTRTELVDHVASEMDTSRRQADAIVDTVVTAIVNSLSSGERVDLRGLGSFRTRRRDARTARNPRSGEQVMVAARTVPVFKASKQLRDAVATSPASD